MSRSRVIRNRCAEFFSWRLCCVRAAPSLVCLFPLYAPIPIRTKLRVEQMSFDNPSSTPEPSNTLPVGNNREGVRSRLGLAQAILYVVDARRFSPRPCVVSSVRLSACTAPQAKQCIAASTLFIISDDAQDCGYICFLRPRMPDFSSCPTRLPGLSPKKNK